MIEPIEFNKLATLTQENQIYSTNPKLAVDSNFNTFTRILSSEKQLNLPWWKANFKIPITLRRGKIFGSILSYEKEYIKGKM